MWTSSQLDLCKAAPLGAIVILALGRAHPLAIGLAGVVTLSIIHFVSLLQTLARGRALWDGKQWTAQKEVKHSSCNLHFEELQQLGIAAVQRAYHWLPGRHAVTMSIAAVAVVLLGRVLRTCSSISTLEMLCLAFVLGGVTRALMNETGRRSATATSASTEETEEGDCPFSEEFWADLLPPQAQASAEAEEALLSDIEIERALALESERARELEQLQLLQSDFE